jgi:two-component system, cell cycle sensor histidine kinase and response regulator CckA
MPEGGRLVIEVELTELDEEYVYMHPGTEPGRYVRLKVSDTGVGMDAATVDRIFEPFFTTKDDGTGLGLATVYGIVTGAGGRIDVYSEPGVGTTVKVHLPVCESQPDAPQAKPGAAPDGRGEVVLVVEDEPDVRRMAERILGKGGYTVIGTTEGAKAIELCREGEQAIDLLLTDVIMPEMLGTELVERIREIQPGMRVIYMSGYSHEVLAPQALTENGASAFIEKPFNGRQLLETVRELLDRPAALHD